MIYFVICFPGKDNIVVSSFFRGSEPSYLPISELNEAKMGKWIDNQRLKELGNSTNLTKNE